MAFWNDVLKRVFKRVYERVYMMPCLSHHLEHKSIICLLFIKPEGRYKSRKYTRFKTGCVYRGQSKRGSGSNAYQNILFGRFKTARLNVYQNALVFIAGYTFSKLCFKTLFRRFKRGDKHTHCVCNNVLMISWRLARMLPRELRRCTMSAGLILNPMTGRNNITL